MPSAHNNHTPPGLSRRSLLAGFGAGALGLGLAGCGAAQADPSKVAVWDLFSGADGEKTRGMIAEVVEENPALNVEPTTLSWGNPYYTKLAMAAASSAPPSTAIMHVSRVAGFAPGGLIEPWDMSLFEEFDVSTDTFTKALLEACQYDGKQYAVPLDTHPFISFFDRDVAEKAGVLESDGTLAIDSPEALQEVGTKLGEVTGGPGIAFGYQLDTAQAWRLFWGLFHQTGGEYSFEPGEKADMDIDAAARVVAAVNSWMDDKCMASSQDYPGALSAFNGGRNAMIFSGVWELNGFKESVKSLAGAPMPTMFGTPANYADSHTYVFPKNRRMTDELRRNTYFFVSSMLKKGDQWGAAGHIPGYLPSQEEPAYRELEIQNQYKDAAETVVVDPKVWFAGAGSDFQNRVCQRLIEGFRGSVEPQRAIEGMLDVISGIAMQPNPTE